jgi:hypothetical protein
MTRITPERLSQLNFIGEDIMLALRILRVTESGKPVSLDQAAFALRELERAAANLADYRGHFCIESAPESAPNNTRQRRENSTVVVKFPYQLTGPAPLRTAQNAG